MDSYEHALPYLVTEGKNKHAIQLKTLKCSIKTYKKKLQHAG